MKGRDNRYVHLPPPPYYLEDSKITLTVHHRGEFQTQHVAKYVGGKFKMLDYVNAKALSKKRVFKFYNEINEPEPNDDVICMGEGVVVDDTGVDIGAAVDDVVVVDGDDIGVELGAVEDDVLVVDGDDTVVDLGVVEEDVDGDEISDVGDSVSARHGDSIGNGDCENGDCDENGDSVDDDDDDGVEFLARDYAMEDESADDDNLFQRNVDPRDSQDDLDEHMVSNEDEEGPHYPLYNLVEKYNRTFPIGLEFSIKAKFREAIKSHAIKIRRTLKTTKNDAIRVYVRCSGKDSKWRINVVKVKDEATFRIREYNNHHTCPETFHAKNLKTDWIYGIYLQKFKSDPKRNVKEFREDVINEINCNVSRNQAYKAKRKALKLIKGSPDYKYTRLWDYADALRRTNPGSTIILRTKDDSEGIRSVRRHGIGFLTMLKQDLNIVKDPEYTFISKKQKGFVGPSMKCFRG
ncbi:hypothetical protein BUALT_Bualt15G0122600 [Buddleja alternifolia]|uniref:Transposase MuDR plant domain-containing protein n=1 Tax=Buddleja alternifolia TaxID=168488 RepID=A0AAV6WL70_9LAMI|nr:hypothetical protein BUALT_Bualt15G0122600 [Buddleja alternifolia]